MCGSSIRIFWRFRRSTLRRVVDTDVYDVHGDDRPKGSLNGQQSQVTYRQADKAVWDQLSDHCPVLVELWIR